MKKLHFLLGFALLFTGCSAHSNLPVSPVTQQLRSFAQSNKLQTAFHSTAILRIPRPDLIPQALTSLRNLQTLTRKESGNRAFIVHQDQKDAQNILIWEVFDTEADFQKHLQSPHLQAFLQSQLLSFLQGFTAIRQAADLPDMGQGFYSTALLTLQAGQSASQAEQALAGLEAQTRQESGNKAFLVFSVQKDGQQAFVIWEYFTNEAAFQAHLNSSYLQKFLAANLIDFKQGYTLQPIH